LIFDFSKKWDREERNKKLPVFDFKKAKELETSLLNTKCGKCSDLQYSDIKGYYFCGFDWRFLPKEAPTYFAEKCKPFTPLTIYCKKPINERARRWMERMNPESRYEDYIPIEFNEASSNWKRRAMRNV